LGDLAFFYQAFFQGQAVLRTFFDEAGQVYVHSLFLNDLFEFLDLRSSILEPKTSSRLQLPLKEGLRIKKVTFRYAGSERDAVRELDLFIPAGKTTALLGANGSGKSTLIKLLCRLYDPLSGSIELDGTDLRRFSAEELRQNITVLFQEPAHYQMTARENIRLGDLKMPSHSRSIEDAARASGADQVIANLRLGPETLLGSWFSGGTQISVGEWQRLALGRAFLRRAPIMILDEPTSAMDPWAEAEWLEHFSGLASGRTVLMITHRLTTARAADHIHVMNQGRVIESGSHEELLAVQGLYAGSWAGMSG